ncbi:aliphatic sulfonate ABC transporter substrate-binding protein [Lentzea sp. NBRC 105346]|uniref:ABC transporter substrate-binding protein n=1 Tax=Lentzea sp. NBRC 105346 TaxID=3032205 RepID=UPI0024A05F44|nr:ABC transporter substrate-binding protein [Lentzea sp. NBRC 105346]GLZ33348.1 aliphatic sulfonate ABC transporter substrate-binding protein [Lentzea sp. NBRC 105346]
MQRRSFLAGLAGLGALSVVGCSTTKATTQVVGTLPADPPPAGTKLTISIRSTLKQLEANGELSKLPFQVPDWPNISAGPDVIQAFRANSVDLASNAGIPPIQAKANRFDAKIVAVAQREQPLYKFAGSPGLALKELKDLKGKKIAFSQGQAQGVVLLRTIKELGLKNTDVELVSLTSNQFLTALQAKQVDVAVLAEPQLTKYLGQYPDAHAIDMNAVDLLTILWAPVSVLNDEAKLKAIRAFIPFWARGHAWSQDNPDKWVDHYYVKDQNVSKADGDRIVKATPKLVFPSSWDRAIRWEQETADLLADGGFTPKINADELFDRRFEHIAFEAVDAKYRSQS